MGYSTNIRHLLAKLASLSLEVESAVGREEATDYTAPIDACISNGLLSFDIALI